ncbi:PLP-dependent transferase, partial [Streptomyces sp. SID14478]|uniref:PLP-dependent transferase n=1 Tax=Streptomyces sp. SID14478 TaxID=2706073 RepID=UPI001410B218
ARRLAADPRVTRVHYPRIGGAMVAFEVAGDPHAVIAGVELITPAVSLGSVDSLLQHPASISHRVVAADDRRAAGVSDRLLRLSVGLEDVADLWADLDRALGAAQRPLVSAARPARRAEGAPQASPRVAP